MLSRAKATGEQTASDLKDFGSRAWLRGLLENPTTPAYFGKVPRLGAGMVEWKKSSKLKPEELDNVADFVASFARIPRRYDARRNGRTAPACPITRATRPFKKECGQCHAIEGYTEGGTRSARPLRLGLAPVDQPDDPQARRSRSLRLS